MEKVLVWGLQTVSNSGFVNGSGSGVGNASGVGFVDGLVSGFGFVFRVSGFGFRVLGFLFSVFGCRGLETGPFADEVHEVHVPPPRGPVRYRPPVRLSLLKMAHLTQSTPDSGLGLQVKVRPLLSPVGVKAGS